MWELLNTHTFQVVALGTGILGLVCGVIGNYVTLRRQSLLGDAVGHAALPGIVIAFLIIREKNLLFLLLGAAVSGLLATFLIEFIAKKTPVKMDSALSLTLSSFFGLGTALLTYAQRFPTTQQAGLENFIFGQASAMLTSDVKTIATISGIVLLLVIVFWKEFKLLTFDSHFAKTLPGPYRALDTLLSVLIVATIVIGLESVGVILISSLLVAPAIAARQWSNRLPVVSVLSGIFGMVSAVVGTFFSSMGRRIPTGPSIVVVATLIVFFSILFAPNRGLIATRRAKKKKQENLKKEIVKNAKGNEEVDSYPAKEVY